MKKKKAGITVIKDAMGHETEEQTNVYLEEVDDSEITESIEEALNSAFF